MVRCLLPKNSFYLIRYKKLYKEEKERMEVLRRHFHDELRKKDEEIDRLRKRVQEVSMETDIKVRSLEVTQYKLSQIDICLKLFVSTDSPNVANVGGYYLM